jgi:uncharacterized protein YceH (UPF0502 family)
MELLDAPEARVLGCLIEKQLATPQYYPLTLNALLAACNQSSNREPVTAYSEADVASGLGGLRDKGLARVVHSSGNRVAKYRHVLDETWGLDAAHRAVLAVLLLRGPQTLGELRARTERLADFASLADIEEVLRLLGAREEPLVCLLERQPGQKEARYAQLLSGDVPLTTEPERARRDSELAERVVALEESVAALHASVAELRALLE